jgi:Transposase IS200 like
MISQQPARRTLKAVGESGKSDLRWIEHQQVNVIVQRPEICGRYKDGVLWPPSYFIGSGGGAPLAVIAEYIRNQRKAAPPSRPEGRVVLPTGLMRPVSQLSGGAGN